MTSRFLALLALAAVLAAPSVARADEAAASTMHAAVRDYYDAEVKTSFLFVGFGAVTAGGGAVALTEPGQFAHGLGWSSLVLGGLTAVGGAGYGVAAKLRGDHYEDLLARDPAAFKREEGDRIAGTNKRFWLYLGYELLETAAGVGIAAYGAAAKNDSLRGVGVGTAAQGIGLFVIDVPGAGRASRYQEQIKSFNPGVAWDGRSFTATMSRAF
ncbi:MAG TPA: hypothetical protein VIF62_16390 [Labilithrix sp.]